MVLWQEACTKHIVPPIQPLQVEAGLDLIIPALILD
jgi:hypothetical protein